MSDQKRGPGRPRKWASDAERMFAHRAAKRRERAEADEREAADHAKSETPPSTSDCGCGATSPPASPTPPPPVSHEWCNATIDALRDQVSQLEADFDTAACERWMHEQRFLIALHRMREVDPDGLDWLDDQLRKWAARRRAAR